MHAPAFGRRIAERNDTESSRRFVRGNFLIALAERINFYVHAHEKFAGIWSMIKCHARVANRRFQILRVFPHFQTEMHSWATINYARKNFDANEADDNNENRWNENGQQ